MHSSKLKRVVFLILLGSDDGYLLIAFSVRFKGLKDGHSHNLKILVWKIKRPGVRILNSKDGLVSHFVTQ